MKTGRPIEVTGARYEDGEEIVWPGPLGVHNWHAMSYSPKTGLVYIPKIELSSRFNDQKIELVDWNSPSFKLDVAVDTDFAKDIPVGTGVSALIAWDPVKQKKVWEVPQDGFWNPGTMVTAGDLVFQGRANGDFVAYDAKTGKKLWSEFLGSGISAPPITYAVDGRQYVSILVGWGGAGVGFAGRCATRSTAGPTAAQTRRLFTFALDGEAKMPAFEPPAAALPMDDPGFAVDPARVELGKQAYAQSLRPLPRRRRGLGRQRSRPARLRDPARARRLQEGRCRRRALPQGHAALPGAQRRRARRPHALHPQPRARDDRGGKARGAELLTLRAGRRRF